MFGHIIKGERREGTDGLQCRYCSVDKMGVEENNDCQFKKNTVCACGLPGKKDIERENYVRWERVTIRS